jgi:hypothetical protein
MLGSVVWVTVEEGTKKNCLLPNFWKRIKMEKMDRPYKSINTKPKLFLNTFKWLKSEFVGKLSS